MEKVFRATDARKRFGELIREAQQAPVIIERNGKPVVVVLSKREYDQLMAQVRSVGWRVKLDRAHELIRNGEVQQLAPWPAEVLEKMREERDEQLLLKFIE